MRWYMCAMIHNETRIWIRLLKSLKEVYEVLLVTNQSAIYLCAKNIWFFFCSTVPTVRIFMGFRSRFAWKSSTRMDVFMPIRKWAQNIAVEKPRSWKHKRTFETVTTTHIAMWWQSFDNDENLFILPIRTQGLKATATPRESLHMQRTDKRHLRHKVLFFTWS